MTSEWKQTVERYRPALLRVVLQLLAAAGLLADGTIAPRNIGYDTIFRRIHRSILRELRPAEAALRRLIVIAARGLKVEIRERQPKAATGAGKAPTLPPEGRVGPSAAMVRGGGQNKDSSTPTPASDLVSLDLRRPLDD